MFDAVLADEKQHEWILLQEVSINHDWASVSEPHTSELNRHIYDLLYIVPYVFDAVI